MISQVKGLNKKGEVAMTPIPVMAIMIGIPGSGKSTFCKSELPQYV